MSAAPAGTTSRSYDCHSLKLNPAPLAPLESAPFRAFHRPGDVDLIEAPFCRCQPLVEGVSGVLRAPPQLMHSADGDGFPHRSQPAQVSG
jgi:hypothetical protein